MAALTVTARKLAQTALCGSTKKAYGKALQNYNNFVNSYYDHDSSFPVNFDHLQRYIAYLHHLGLAIGSVQSALSAINYIHKAMGGADVFQNVWVARMMLGFKKSHTPVQDSRQPFTTSSISKLCAAVDVIHGVSTDAVLLKSMFRLSFHAFLRVGEITVSKQLAQNPNLLQRNQIRICPTTHVIDISFSRYKHSKSLIPFKLAISTAAAGTLLATDLEKYLGERGSAPGPLFLRDSSPVSNYYFTTQLKRCLEVAGMDSSKFKTHSFRIGAATSSILRGATHEQVRQMGRWHSDAFQRYIRVQSFNKT